MFKKLLKGMVALGVLLMLNNPAQAFYTDMNESHWAYQSIKFLTEIGVVVGYPDGTYKPDIPVTRAEFASMAIKALGQEDATVTQDIHFSDIAPSFWAYNIIKKAVYFDLIPDADGQRFRPYESVTRAEAISIAVNALTTSQISEQRAKDIISKSHEKIDFKKNKNKKLFVFVGRLDDSSKKLKRAINLVKEISSIELLIVGDGPDRKMYEDFTKKCKVENRVTFVGSKENPYPYMNEADYVILTSDYEGFPVTYLEAITLNKNIITTIETSDESIDMKDIAYIIPKKENEMVEKVKEILKKKDTKKSINIDKIQKNKIKIFEELFDN